MPEQAGRPTEPPEVPPRQIVPPTRPGVMPGISRPPVWPTVLGVICAVAGGLGAVGAVGQLLAPLFLGMVRDTLGDTGAEELMGMVEKHAVHSMVLYGFGLVLAVVLLIGGVLVAKRRAGGVTLLLWWSLARVPWTVGLLWLTFLTQREQMKFMMAQQGAPVPQFKAIMTGVNVGTLVFVAIWSMALPVFLIVWFRREKIAAQIKEWR